MGIIKIPTAGMSRQEWLKLRKEGIGGSDAGAICGLNPYSSPMSIYQDKTSLRFQRRIMKPCARAAIWRTIPPGALWRPPG